MKTIQKTSHLGLFVVLSLVLLLQPFSTLLAENPTDHYIEFRGLVVDKSTGNALAFANISLQGTNMTTVSNTAGEFSLKIPAQWNNRKMVVRFVGYQTKMILLSESTPGIYKIELNPVAVELPELNVLSKDAEALMKEVYERVPENYPDRAMQMTAFYRETIRKNRNYVSVAEAVIDIHKQSYPSYKDDIVKMYKSRKKTDYEKLDTLVFKLKGGPFNSLFLDLVKYPDFIFTEKMFENYKFSFDKATHMDDRLIYVLNFVQSVPNTESLYFGKLYIDAQSKAIKSAVFSLNVANKTEAARMFIVKKPFNARVIPNQATYRMDYVEQNGKWYYAYSRIELDLRIKWKRKLFDTRYLSTVEMAVTDWKNAKELKSADRQDRLRSGVIIADEANGFGDPAFWGEYNVIEPEKPIEAAIKKIQKKLDLKE